jgi:acid phosphatase (class A)
LIATVLSLILPTKKEKLMARADQIALDRVIGGVHHPSDIREGKHLADLVVQDLLKNSHFKRDLAKVKKSLDSEQLLELVE